MPPELIGLIVKASDKHLANRFAICHLATCQQGLENRPLAPRKTVKWPTKSLGLYEISHHEVPKRFKVKTMNRQDYWNFVEQIWNDPLDTYLRLVFADWLEDQHHFKLANKQRMWASVINNCHRLWKREEASFNDLLTSGRRRFKMVWKLHGEIHRPKKAYNQSFEVKRDSSIVFHPKGVNFSLNSHHGVMMLKGTLAGITYQPSERWQSQQPNGDSTGKLAWTEALHHVVKEYGMFTNDIWPDYQMIKGDKNETVQSKPDEADEGKAS